MQLNFTIQGQAVFALDNDLSSDGPCYICNRDYDAGGLGLSLDGDFGQIVTARHFETLEEAADFARQFADGFPGPVAPERLATTEPAPRPDLYQRLRSVERSANGPPDILTKGEFAKWLVDCADPYPATRPELTAFDLALDAIWNRLNAEKRAFTTILEELT